MKGPNRKTEGTFKNDNPETRTPKTQPVKVSKLKGPNRKTEGTFKNDNPETRTPKTQPVKVSKA
jgi:hypothetical protein